MSASTDEYRWRWHADDYERAAAAGIFGEEPRVELIEGEVLTVAAMLPPHANAVRALVDASRRVDVTSYTVGSQLPVRLSDLSEPEPDLWLADGPWRRFRTRHPEPSDLLLVVEVADTSLRLDREVKLPAYAAAGVAEVWLVALPERAVWVHTGPVSADRRYRTTTARGPGDQVAHAATGLTVAVDDLLP